jgi:hypothetical protein
MLDGQDLDEVPGQSDAHRFRESRKLHIPRRARGGRTTTGLTMTSAGIVRLARSATVRASMVMLSITGLDTWDNCAHAQTPSRESAVADRSGSTRESACPGGNGIRISLTSGDSAAAVSRIIDQSRPLDTTIVFDIAERSWTRTNLAAAISVGLADEARGGYMICAGVTALMPSATLTVRGARGRVHFQASLAELTSAIRSAPGAVRPQPRRL